MTVTSVQASNQYSFLNPSTAKAAPKTQEMEFMDLLLAQLKNQDPMEPSSNKDMLAQFASITTVQELRKLTLGIEELSKASSFSYAAGLIGKDVTANVDDKVIAGIVDSVEVDAGAAVLLIGNQRIPIASVTNIRQAAPDQTQNVAQSDSSGKVTSSEKKTATETEG
jgi:flagellar basal-body rod modification protein FlgD